MSTEYSLTSQYVLQCPQMVADRTDEFSCSYACGFNTQFNYTTIECTCNLIALPNADGMTCDFVNCQLGEYVNADKECQQVRASFCHF